MTCLSSLVMSSEKHDNLSACSKSARYSFIEASLRSKLSPFLNALCSSVDSGLNDRSLTHVLFPTSSGCSKSPSSFLADDSLPFFGDS